LAKIELALMEINEIFDKKKHIKNTKGKLLGQDKKTERGCQKKKLLFPATETKCHKPTSDGARNNNKCFVCKKNPCTSDDYPFFINGTYSAL
jgi:hypothetical protein